jgi:hypothetical protein
MKLRKKILKIFGKNCYNNHNVNPFKSSNLLIYLILR